MGIAMGLAAALCWGIADSIAALTGRRVGSLPVVFGLHLSACAFLLVLVVATGALSAAGWDDLPLFLFLAAIGWAGYLAFYRALELGPVAIVSPVASGYVAVTVVLAVILLGERPSGLQWAAVGVVFTGVVFASTDLRGIARAGHLQAQGVLLAIVAMILLGGLVLGVSSSTDELGWLAPVFIVRVLTAAFVGATAFALRPIGFPRAAGLLTAIALLGVIESMGFVFFNIGVGHADTAVVATASAPYAIVPLLVGIALLHERPTPTHWAGVGLVIAGVVLLGLAAG
jgi:drug/metabolite transporter (DMT)-like permease